MPTDVSPPHPCRRFDVIDEEKGTQTAVGTELPSGTLVVEWIPESFPDGDQTEENPGGLMADEREAVSETDPEEDTEQQRPDAFQVAEGGQETL